MEHPCFSVDGKAPEDGASNENGPRAQRQGLENVGAAPDAAIHVDLAAPVDRLHYLRQGFDAGENAVELPTAVIGDDDAVYAMLDRQQRIRGGKDAFEQDGQCGNRTQPGELVPGECYFGAALDYLLIDKIAFKADDEAAAFVALAIAQARQVNRQHNGFVSGLLSPAHQPLAHFKRGIDVELEPEWVARFPCRFRNLLKAARG